MTNFTARRRMPCDFWYSPRIICRTSKLSSLYLFLGLPSLVDLGRLSTNLPYCSVCWDQLPGFLQESLYYLIIFFLFSPSLDDFDRFSTNLPYFSRFVEINSHIFFLRHLVAEYSTSWERPYRMSLDDFQRFDDCAMLLGKPRDRSRSIRNETTGIECRLFNSYVVYRCQHSSGAT